MNIQTCYEFPLNERMRIFMRLEKLCLQLKHFLQGETVLEKRVVMAVLLDISMIFNRNNIKSELLKEVERTIKDLETTTSAPKIIQLEKTQDSLAELRQIREALCNKKGRIGEQLTQNYLFQSYSQRHVIPGGTFSFDLPAFHYWLSQTEAEQQVQLEQWTQPFLEIHHILDILLNLLRNRCVTRNETAKAGFFQLSLDSQANCQILRVNVPQELSCFAEISGGRHRFTVRFILPATGSERPKQTTKDIDFNLQCCQL